MLLPFWKMKGFLMNYLELINKCLVELNYKQVNAFAELVKNDHKKLKNIINIINSEICGSDKWDFLQRKSSFTLPKNTGEIENNIDGRINSVIVDGCIYDYCADYEKFFTNSQPHNTYSLFGDKILFPIFNQDKTVQILYFTKNCATDNDGHEKFLMEKADDKSLIPVPFVEPLLVYGACMRLKGNPQHVRFNYWFSMYKDALANLKSRSSSSVKDVPWVRVWRN